MAIRSPNRVVILGLYERCGMKKNSRGVRSSGTGRRKGMRTTGTGYIGGTMHNTRHDWATIRNRILDRDGRRCGEGAYGCLGVATEVHHIIEQVFGGTDDDDNLISLCEACHQRKTVALRQELNKRRKAEQKEQKRRSHPGYIAGRDGN